jgi:hypothetical protein
VSVNLTERMSPKTQRWALRGVVLGVLVVVGIVLLVFFRNTGSPIKSTFSNQRPDIVVPEKTVPLSKEERRVAGRFILTAVQRKHLDQAWKLSGPHVRQDLTYKQWLSGSIPVVPFLGKIGTVGLSVKVSTPTHAYLDVAVSPAKGSQGTPQLFSLEVRRYGKGAGGHWLVDSWAPLGSTPVPGNPSK